MSEQKKKDMFSGYDEAYDPENFKEIRFDGTEVQSNDYIQEYTGTVLMHDIRNKVTGIKAKRNTCFYMYFFLDSASDNVYDIITKGEFHCELLDYTTKEVLVRSESLPVEKYDNLTVRTFVDLTSKAIRNALDLDSVYDYKMFRIHLSVDYDGYTYDLFSDDSALLRIE